MFETNVKSFRRGIYYILLLSIFYFLFTGVSFGASLTKVSAIAESSVPNKDVDHRIIFTLTNAVPVGGKIVVIPQAGVFTIPTGFDHSDADLLIGSTNKILSASGGVGTDFVVSVVTGTSGSITFTSQATSTPAGSVITLRLGKNATYIDVGDKQIRNPVNVGTYNFTIETRNAGNALLDSATTVFAIMQPIGVSASFGEVSQPSPPPAPSGGGDGGGGGGGMPDILKRVPTGEITFCGKGYPRESVVLLKDGQIATTTIATIDEDFSIRLKGLEGAYLFGLYGTDRTGVQSLTTTFTASARNDVVVNTECVVLAPTIRSNKSEVRHGDTVVISGQTMSFADIHIEVAPGNSSSPNKQTLKTKSDKNGLYSYTINTSPLIKGATYVVVATASKGASISQRSKNLQVYIGDKNVFLEEISSAQKPWDFNSDQKVNLIDFSILAYWYKRPVTTVSVKYDLNKDGKIDLRDFSILAFYWTG